MTGNNPTVSVIITTYNRVQFLGRAVKSVLSQTFRDFELIVVDDASKDDTEKVVESFADARILYIKHEENKGGPAARNTGIEKARGVYLAFLDDDDEWLPSKLEKQVKKFEETPDSVGLIYTGTEIREEGRDVPIKTYYPEFRGDVKYRLLSGSMIGSVSKVLVKKECFKEVGLFDESLKSCQDWDMWKRISDRYEFDFVPEILSINYLHDVQLSADFGSLIAGRTRMVEKYFDEFKQHPDILIAHLKRLGKLHCINGTWSEAAYWFKEAVKVNFFEIFKILAWGLLELPVEKFFSRSKGFKKYKKENGNNK